MKYLTQGSRRMPTTVFLAHASRLVGFFRRVTTVALLLQQTPRARHAALLRRSLRLLRDDEYDLHGLRAPPLPSKPGLHQQASLALQQKVRLRPCDGGSSCVSRRSMIPRSLDGRHGHFLLLHSLLLANGLAAVAEHEGPQRGDRPEAILRRGIVCGGLDSHSRSSPSLSLTCRTHPPHSSAVHLVARVGEHSEAASGDQAADGEGGGGSRAGDVRHQHAAGRGLDGNADRQAHAQHVAESVTE